MTIITPHRMRIRG